MDMERFSKLLDEILRKIDEINAKWKELPEASIDTDTFNKAFDLLIELNSLAEKFRESISSNIEIDTSDIERAKELLSNLGSLLSGRKIEVLASPKSSTEEIERYKETIKELILQFNRLRELSTERIFSGDLGKEDLYKLIDIIVDIDSMVRSLKSVLNDIEDEKVDIDSNSILDFKKKLDILYTRLNEINSLIREKKTVSVEVDESAKPQEKREDIRDFFKEEVKVEVDDSELREFFNEVDDNKEIDIEVDVTTELTDKDLESIEVSVDTDEEKANKVKEALGGVKKSLRDLLDEYKSLVDFFNKQGISTDELKAAGDEIEVEVKRIADNIKQFAFPNNVKLYYREDLDEFFTSLREAKKAFSTDFLKQLKQDFKAVFEEARRFGFSIENLKNVEEISGGVRKFSFVMQDANNVTRRLTIYSDRLGRVLVDNQKRFLSFTDAIVRNTLEAARWAVAVSLVYGSMQKLNRAIDDAIENQERLASIAVVLGTGSKSLEQVFQSAYEVANRIGSSVEDVLDGYITAYRVAGSVAKTEAERFATAEKLMADAMVLSRLTGEDSARSLDLLIAAVKQTGNSINYTTELLDKWVYVSKKSNVTTLDLVEAFSLAAASARSAGLQGEEGINKLTGYITALAEGTSYTGEEIGNILKSLFSNIQSAEAKRKLNDFGISVRDVSGELRDFDSILNEIYTKYKQGIISEEQLGEIGRAIGGGARRGPQFVALIQNLDRAVEVTNSLADANINLGYSYNAVDIKTKTVRSDLNRMSNSFQQLAASIGEAGALDAISKFAKIVGYSTEFLTKLISVTGNAGIVGTMTVLTEVFKKSAYTVRFLDRTIETLVRTFYRLGRASDAVIEGKVQAALQNSSKYAKVIQTGLIAATSFMTSDTLIGGAFSATGAALGMYIAGPFGAVLGASLGEVIGNFIDQFVNATETELAPQVSKILSAAISEGVESGIREGTKAPPRAKEIEQQILDFDTMMMASAVALGATIYEPLNVGGIFDEYLFEFEKTKAFKDASMREKAMAEIVNSYKTAGPEATKEFYKLSDRDLELLKEYVSMLDLASSADVSKPFDEAQSSISLANNGYKLTVDVINEINRLQEEYKKKTEEAYAAGEISYKQYRDNLDKIRRFNAVLVPIVQDLSRAIQSTGQASEDSAISYERMANIFMNATNEEMQLLLAYDAEIKKVRAETGKIGTEKEQKLVQDLIKTLDLIESNIARRQLKLPVYMDYSNMTLDEFELFLQEVMKLQEEYIKAAVDNGLVPDEETLRKYYQGLQPILIMTKEGFTKAIQGVDIQKFGAKALKNLQEQGVLNLDNTFNIRLLDIPSGRKNELIAALDKAARTLQQFAPYYKMDVRPLGVVFKDNVTDILHVDMLQLQLALRELVELNRDQLDGIYNLPSDATFFVPWMAWELAANAALNQSSTGQEQQQEETKVLSDDELKGLLDQDIRNGQEMLQYLSEILNATNQIKERQLTPEELKYFKLAEPYVTEMQHGSIFSSEQIEQLGEYLYSKLSKPEKAVVDMQHGSVSNIDEGIKNYENYLRAKAEQQGKVQKEEDTSIPILERIANTLDIIKGTIEKTFDFRDMNEFEIPIPQFNWQDFLDAFRSLDLKTDLNINLIQNVQLEVDGKVLYAQVMKYLYRDVLSRSKSTTVARINNLI